MPKYTKILLITTIVLGLFAWLSVSKSNRKATFDSEDALFAIADSGSISKIVLTSRKNETVTLSSFGKRWKINDTWLDDQSLSFGLVNLIYKVQVKRPVFKELEEKALNELKSNGIQVKLFNKDELVRTYTLATDSTDQLALFGLIDGYSIVYSIELPGNDQPLSALLDAQPATWRTKSIFTNVIGSIQSLKVMYNNAPSDNFEINLKGKIYTVNDMSNADSVKILSYLDLYKNIEIKQYLNVESKKDSLIKTLPSFVIEVSDKIESKSNIIKIYYRDKQKGPIYGLVGNQNELVTIRPRLFEYLLQKRSFFETKKNN